MKHRKKEIAFYTVTIISCLIAMIIVVIAALLIYDKVKENGGQDNREKLNEQEVLATLPVSYSQTEVDAMVAAAVEKAVSETAVKVKEETKQELLDSIAYALSTGQTAMQTLRPFYPDKLVVSSGGVYHFVPINRDLEMHERLQENLQVLESGEFQYVEDGQVVSHKGIDVSRYQGKIDWKQVAEDGVEYVIIRLGIRGYGAEGNLALDDMFVKNIEGAQAAGLKVGVYFFTQALTVDEAKQEARFVMEQLAPYKIDYPVVLDVEKVSAEGARMNALDATQRTDVAIAFLEEIKAAGYKPMIYANTEMFSVLLEIDRLEAYDKWFAYYGEEMYFPYDYAMWQYTEKGTVAGIKGNVDMNISFKEW